MRSPACKWLLRVGVGLVLVGVKGAGTSFAQNPGTAELPCTSVKQELNFSNYWLGPSFEGMELTAVLRDCAGARINSITYVYGDCTPQGGGCSPPLQIQVWPASLRNKEMYSSNPPLFQVSGTDHAVNGIPATSYGGHFEVYYPDTTVVIYGDAAPKHYVAGFLVKGPSRLVLLAEHGLYFDTECLDNAHRCEADRSVTSEDAEFLREVISFYGLMYGIPFLVAVFFGRLWLLLLPVVGWSSYFVAGSMGWVATGESWQFFIIPMMLLGVAVVGLGLTLRWLVLSVVRSRRRFAS